MCFFVCLFCLWQSSFEKALLCSFAHFFIGSLNFGKFSC
jgi:hypothetical protein